jgi:hypothetical protein
VSVGDIPYSYVYGTVRILDTEKTMHAHDEDGGSEKGRVVEEKGTDDGRKTKKKKKKGEKKEHVRKKAWKPKTKTGCKTCR